MNIATAVAASCVLLILFYQPASWKTVLVTRPHENYILKHFKIPNGACLYSGRASRYLLLHYSSLSGGGLINTTVSSMRLCVLTFLHYKKPDLEYLNV